MKSWRFYLWQTTKGVAGEEGFWKQLAVAFDAEGAGLMERILISSGLKWKCEEKEL